MGARSGSKVVQAAVKFADVGRIFRLLCSPSFSVFLRLRTRRLRVKGFGLTSSDTKASQRSLPPGGNVDSATVRFLINELDVSCAGFPRARAPGRSSFGGKEHHAYRAGTLRVYLEFDCNLNAAVILVGFALKF